MWSRAVFNNGNKLIALGLLALAGSIIYAGFVWLSPEDDRFEPLGNYNNPQPIQNEGPYRAGGAIEVIAIKCNLSDEVVIVSGNSEWQQLGEGQRQIAYRMGTGEFFPSGFDLTEEDRARGWDDDGCRTTLFSNTLPDDITLGIWVLEGTDTARKGDKTQDTHWETEPFEVVP